MLNRLNKIVNKIVKNVINFIYDNSPYHHMNNIEKRNKSSPKILIRKIIPAGTFSIICALSVISISAVTVGQWNLVDSS